MLGTPVTVTYASESIDLHRINQDNYASTYFGKNAAGDAHLTLAIKHTIPARGGEGESHLVRLDVEHYASGVYVRTSSAWTVVKTSDNVQDDTSSANAAEVIEAFMGTASFASVLGRQS